MNKKLQIFISSTFDDLKVERQLVIEAILELGHLPAGMEYFVSDGKKQFDVIKKWIEDSDAFILISGGRYGTINEKNKSQKSFTHLEYEYACKLNKPIKIIRLSDKYLEEKAAENKGRTFDFENKNWIKFREKLSLANNVDKLEDLKNVTKTLVNDLSEKLISIEGSGWIKEDNIINVLQMHPSNCSKAKKKLICGDYYIYYYNIENILIRSVLKFNFNKDLCLVYFENGLSEKDRYTYNGLFDIYDDFLYVELRSSTDNEKANMIIKLYPGKLKLSFGIIAGQGTSKEVVASDFIISNEEIIDESVLEPFKNIQKRIIDNDSVISDIKQKLNNCNVRK